MSMLTVDVLSGILIAAFSSLASFLYGRTRVRSVMILPGKIRARTRRTSYQYLAGHWYLYYVSVVGVPAAPAWLRGEEELYIQRNGRIRGITRLSTHPTLHMTYTVCGEIRGGWLLLTDACNDDTQEFATVVIPNLLNGSLLVGLWTGQDNTRTLISAPTVLSRTPLSARQLNNAVISANLRIATPESRPKLHSLLAQTQLIDVGPDPPFSATTTSNT